MMYLTQKDWRPVKTAGVHTRAFPLRMVTDILECFEHAKVVLDPFGGSGTVGVGCMRLNRNYILIEKEDKYVEYAKDRLTAESKELI